MAYDLKNEDEAKEYIENVGVEYRFQCFHEKKPEGCHRLADFEEMTKKDFNKAAKVYKINCDDNRYGHSCFKYANYCLLGRGMKKDFREGFDYYLKGCDLDYLQSCNNLAMMFGGGKVSHKKDFNKAVEYFNKACSGGFASSCFQLSGIYITGKDEVPKDMKKAHDYAVKACDLGVYYACANLSRMYQLGDGVEKDAAIAEKYKQKAKDTKENVEKVTRTLTFGQ